MSTPFCFQIPGNIKQQFQPFVLNPSAKLNAAAGSSREVEGASPQYFTYKSVAGNYGSGAGTLRFYPGSLDEVCINDDISLKLLYGRDNNGQITKKSITLQDILNTVPGVQIREFLPDTRLDQCINLFCDMFKNMTKLFSKDDAENGNKDKQEQKDLSVGELASKLISAAWFTVKYMVGAYPNGPSFIKDMGNSFAGTTFPNYSLSTVDSDVGHRIMAFPYALYYRLQSCVTTNIYEVPGVPSSKTITSSPGGMSGWTDGGDIFSEGGFRLSGILGKIPVVGNLANMILGNIGINYCPWWNAESGTKTKMPEVEVKFDLYNDSSSSAMVNFIFVNTLVSGNKFVQYGMFQHSSNIYDVKIEGINRLYACAGSFDVAYEGVLRDPPKAWVDQLVDSFGNQCVSKASMKAAIIKSKLIKVPDIYKVTMKFQSLLPDNFNNYIFNFAENKNQIEQYHDTTYQASGLADAIPGAMAKYVKRVTKVFDAGSEDAGKGDASE